MKHIATHLYKPYKKSDRTEVRRYHCKLEGECPLLARGKCIHLDSFRVCHYGKVTVEKGPTQRAKSYHKFIDTAEEEENTMPRVRSYGDNKGMAYIGDYVYLPYPFIDNDVHGNLPMMAHSGLFRGGSYFMKRNLFTAEMVVKILQFRPHALMGGEITDYQRIHMPRFARDLQSADPELYAEVVAIYPQIVEVASRGEKQPLPIRKLGNFTGKVIVNGAPGFLYRSGLELEFPSMDGVPAEGEVTVKFVPTDDVMCIIVDDQEHIEQADILRKKEKNHD